MIAGENIERLHVTDGVENMSKRGDFEAGLHRHASVDFDFYRRRAVHERRQAKQVWLKALLRWLAQYARAGAASFGQHAAGRSAPLARCCLAAERRVCCA
jgi:hypothetical protein